MMLKINQINTETLKKNFFYIVMLVLLVVVLFQTCKKNSNTSSTVTIHRDTVWVVKDSTVYSKPQLIKTIQITPEKITKEYIPDTNYASLVKQYQNLVQQFLATNIQSDSLKIDSIGHVYVTDTVTKNLVVGRKYDYKLTYPIITNTITVPEKKRNQWYIGGDIQGNQITPVNQISAGLLFKNKNDQIKGAKVGLNFNGQFLYGVQSYWKIKLRK